MGKAIHHVLLVSIYMLVLNNCFCHTTTDVTEQATCLNEHVLAVQNTENGTSIFFSALTSDPFNFTIAVPGRYLPSLECGKDYTRCGIFVFEQEPTVIAFIPSVGGFLRVTHLRGQGTQNHFEEVSKPCSPSALFSDGKLLDFRLFIACFNLSLEADGRGSLYFVEFDNITRTLQESRFSNRQGLHLPNTVSEVVHVPDLEDCVQSGALFVKDTQDILFASTDLTPESPRFNFEDSISNCPRTDHIEYYGDDKLIAYCSNQDAVVLNTCTNVDEYFSILEDGLPYPCMSWNKVLFLKVDKLVISSSDSSNGTEIHFPLGNITYGKCVGPEHNLRFWGLAENGSLYSVDVTGDDHTVVELVSDVCSENATCLRPVFDGNGEAFGAYFDPARMSVSIVNLTSSCDLQHVPIPFKPDLLAVIRASGEHVCYCSHEASPITEPPTTVTTIGTDSPLNVGAIVGGVVGGFILLVLIITVLSILLCILCKKCRRDDVRNKPNGPQQVFQNQVSNQLNMYGPLDCDSTTSLSEKENQVPIQVPNEQDRYGIDFKDDGNHAAPVSVVGNQNRTEVDLEHGKDSAHSPTIIHEESVERNLDKRWNTEELQNDGRRKANAVNCMLM